MLEYAIPSDDLARARDRSGNDHDFLAQRTGARVEIQNITSPPKDGFEHNLHSVLVSGTFEQVSRVAFILASLNPRSFQLRTGMLRTQTSKPSNSMMPWETVLRGRNSSQVKLEMSVPTEAWDCSCTKRDWASIAFREGVSMEISRPELRPADKMSLTTAVARSLILKGSSEAVLLLREMLAGYIPSDTKKSSYSPLTTNSAAGVRQPGSRSNFTVTSAVVEKPVEAVSPNSMAPQRKESRSAPVASPHAEPSHHNTIDTKDTQPQQTSEEQKFLTENVRMSMRSLTHPVALVTSCTRDKLTMESQRQVGRGVIVSSFNSVTLDPRPIVSFNLKVPSRSWDAIRRSMRLCIHLLEASSRGAAIAQVFTKSHDQPFSTLRGLGFEITANRGNLPPLVSDEAGSVLARMEAVLLHDKCVTVGDHVIVLAEVVDIVSKNEGTGDVDGLSYAKQGYRMRGQELVPDEVPLEVPAIVRDIDDPLMLGAEEPTARRLEPLMGATDATTSDHPHPWINLDDDPIHNALRATKEADGDIDVYAAMAMGDETWPSDEKSGSAGRAAQGRPQTTHKESRPVTRRSLGQEDRNSVSGRRSFFTLCASPASRRNVSSTARAFQKHGDNSHLVEPAAKTITVADYLGFPDDNKRPHSHRVRSLPRLQKEIRAAEIRLEQEELSEYEVTAIKESIAQSERIIARKLAWNAAGDLRLMLDKGNARVDFKRAQWLEGAVEKGVKVLLEDAKRLRGQREEGKLDKDKYEMLKTKLETDHGVLQTELMRLRAVADEDVD